MINEDTLAAIRAACEAATPGEWNAKITAVKNTQRGVVMCGQKNSVVEIARRYLLPLCDEVERLRGIVDRERWVCDETTPETSRPVLLRIERRNGKRNTIQAVWVARYTEEACEDYDEEDCDYNPDDDVDYIPEGWYEYVEYGDISNRVSDRVIGWRHLPAQ